MILLGQKGSVVNSFAISFFPPGEAFWLLEYIAVDEDSRNAGVGKALFDETLRRARLRKPNATLLIEVDQPEDGVEITHESARPYQFYRSMMCRRVHELAYILPLDTDPAPAPMMLLTHSTPPLTEVTRAELQRWLSVIYEQVYQKRRTDPRIAKMLADTANTIPCISL